MTNISQQNLSALQKGILVVETREMAFKALPSVDATATLTFVASSALVDRFNESIEPSGWLLDNFRRNPVFLDSHHHSSIASVLGKVTDVRIEVYKNEPCLVIDVNFASEIRVQANEAFRL